MPEFIQPMMCKAMSVEQFKTMRPELWKDYVAELKIDGWRAIIVKDGKDVAVYSRTGKDRAGHVPHIVNAFRDAPNGVYDGELVMMGYSSNDVVELGMFIPPMSFNATARIMGSGEQVAIQKQKTAAGRMWFVMFDVLELGGTPTTELPFNIRRGLVEDVYPYLNFVAKSYQWHVVPSAKNTYAKLFDEVVSNRLEGLVMKNLNGLYVPGGRPSGNQFKIKAEKYFDVVVSGCTWAKEGKFEGLIGALKFGVYDDKQDFIEIGQASGMNDAERMWWTQLLTTPGTTYRDLQVIEIKCNDLTDKVGPDGYGAPRHPQYIRKRDDKNPFDCKLEQFKL